MRASGQDDLADRYQRIHDPALGLFDSSSLSRNPDERRKQLAERRAKIKEIMGGAQTVVIGGQFQQPAAAPAAAPAPDPGAVADALTKLAGLRDRGLLTDDEFQSQKRKLLGE